MKQAFNCYYYCIIVIFFPDVSNNDIALFTNKIGHYTERRKRRDVSSNGQLRRRRSVVGLHPMKDTVKVEFEISGKGRIHRCFYS